MDKHIDEFIRLHPRTECLETPIKDPHREAHDTSWGHKWYDTKIEVDESDKVDRIILLTERKTCQQKEQKKEETDSQVRLSC